MSALEWKTNWAESSISLTKSTLAPQGATASDISRVVTGLVTVNGNTRAAKERKRKKKTRPDPTPMAHTELNRENPEPSSRVISGLAEHLENLAEFKFPTSCNPKYRSS